MLSECSYVLSCSLPYLLQPDLPFHHQQQCSCHMLPVPLIPSNTGFYSLSPNQHYCIKQLCFGVPYRTTKLQNSPPLSHSKSAPATGDVNFSDYNQGKTKHSHHCSAATTMRYFYSSSHVCIPQRRLFVASFYLLGNLLFYIQSKLTKYKTRKVVIVANSV